MRFTTRVNPALRARKHMLQKLRLSSASRADLEPGFVRASSDVVSDHGMISKLAKHAFAIEPSPRHDDGSLGDGLFLELMLTGCHGICHRMPRQMPRAMPLQMPRAASRHILFICEHYSSLGLFPTWALLDVGSVPDASLVRRMRVSKNSFPAAI